MSVFQMDGILPTPMDETEQGGSADWESFFKKVLIESDNIVRQEGLYCVDMVQYPTREEATMARMHVAEVRVKARERAR